MLLWRLPQEHDGLTHLVEEPAKGEAWEQCQEKDEVRMTEQGGLLLREQVPPEFQEEFIQSGYRRPGISAYESIVSVFCWNNETLNFWTHFLALLFFIWKFSSIDVNLVSDPFYWPLLGYACGACAYPLLSSIAHAFGAVSENVRHICFFFDYAGVSIYSGCFGIVFYPYVFPKSLQGPLVQEVYLLINSAFSVVGTYLCCLSRDRKYKNIKYLIRTGVYALPYIFNCTILIYRLVTCEVDHFSPSIPSHYTQFIWCTLMAVTNVARLPERLVPKSFDYVGHSHQFFHIFVFLGSNTQLDAILADMVHRRDQGRLQAPSFAMSLGLALMIISLNVAVVLFFAYRVLCKSSKSENDKPKPCKKD